MNYIRLSNRWLRTLNGDVLNPHYITRISLKQYAVDAQRVHVLAHLVDQPDRPETIMVLDNLETAQCLLQSMACDDRFLIHKNFLQKVRPKS